jgi:hypothetical protein
LNVICKAFDDAWSEIASKVSEDLATIERARMSLATIVLGLANGQQTPDGLTALAVTVFCVKHRIGPDGANSAPLPWTARLNG